MDSWADPADQALNAPAVSIPETAPVWYVEDLRPTDPAVTVPDGLKALVSSLFGDYPPVTPTSVVTQTVDLCGVPGEIGGLVLLRCGEVLKVGLALSQGGDGMGAEQTDADPREHRHD